MANAFYRPTWVEINLNNITHNIKSMREKLDDQCKLIAVVKANAYGHGAVQVAKKAIEVGVDALAVSLLEEAIELREAGIDVPILMLGRISPQYASVAAKYDITVTVFQKEWIKTVTEELKEGKLSVHLELDTGMGRTGIRSKNDLIEILHALKGNSCIYLTGVYTHFATSDEEDPTYLEVQHEKFEALLDEIRTHWQEPVLIHAANSAASIRSVENRYQAIRFGVSMYGLYPSEFVKNEQRIALKPAFSLHSELIEVKQVQKGQSISYGATYRTTSDEWIGTVPIGYGDGWIRKLQGQSVLINGKRMPIIGRICMDQFMVRLDKEYKVGERVTLIGEQCDVSLPVEEIAEKLETINYEVSCIIGARVPRIYIES